MFIVAFSLTYVLMAQADPAAFSEPMTKSAAIYFTVTTVATVGFGDIVATTDATRLVVTVQMLMGIGILATTARVVLSTTQSRHQALRDARAARPDSDT
jgi:voltage-gated potassium channel Kch